jgi:osmotically-inducible protein OsmY
MNTKVMCTEKPTLDPAHPEFAQKMRSLMIARRGELRSISVHVDRGTVRLVGTVQSFHLKQLAINLARNGARVQQITDELEVATDHDLNRLRHLLEAEIACS